MGHHYTTKLDDVMIAVDEFSSTHDLIKEIESSKDKNGRYIQYRKDEDDSSTRYRTCWTDYETMEGFLTEMIAQSGEQYNYKANDAQNVASKVQAKANWHTTNYKRQKMHSNRGAHLSIQKVWAGKCQKAFTSYKRQARLDKGGVVTIIIPLDVSSHVSEESIYLSSLAGYLLSAVLEAAGKQTEVWAYLYSQGAFKETKTRPIDYVCLNRLKSARERHQLSQFTPILFADYVRRFVMRLMEMSIVRHKSRVSYGYGHPCATSTTGLAFLDTWMKNKHIDTDSMLLTPKPRETGTRSIEDAQQWVQATLDAING